MQHPAAKWFAGSKENIRAIHLSTSQALWVSTATQLLCIENGIISVVSDINATESPWQPRINTLFEDRFHHLWIGSRQGLSTASLLPSPFVAYKSDPSSKRPVGYVFNIYAASDSLLYYAAEEGIFTLQTKTGRVTPVVTRSAGDGIFDGPDSTLILSDHQGLSVITNNAP